MAKAYNVTYKVSFSVFEKRSVKPVEYRGSIVHPLYVLVTYKRKNTSFPAYYFSAFTARYRSMKDAAPERLPTVQNIIRMETDVLNRIVAGLGDEVSLDGIKAAYEAHGRDLLHALEADFLHYLMVFLADEGLPTIARLLQGGDTPWLAAGILDDLRTALKPELLSKLIENAVHYAPPYIPLYGFARSESARPYPVLPIIEWLNPETQQRFISFTEQHYPLYQPQEVIKVIARYIV